MADKRRLQLILDAKDNASKALKSFNSKLEKTAKISKETSKNLKIIGVAATGLAIGIGTKAVQAAASFNKSMSNVSTLVDTNIESMDEMKKAVLDLSEKTPVALEDLSSALYDVRSAGISAASAMEVLENAAILGVAGLGTTKEAANLLTTAINAFGLQSRNSKDVADVLFKTVKAGKTDIAKLSKAFGKMAGNAKAANISFEDAQAATAALTALTGKTSEAQNALAQVFLELTIAGGKLDTGLQENGIGLIELNEAIGDRGLVGGMKLAMDTMGLTAVEFKNLFSSAEGGTVVYQLLTDAFDLNNEALGNMTNGSNELTEAYKKQKKEAEAQYLLLKNQLNIKLIELGNIIIPKLLVGMENGILIMKEWKSWFNKIADVLGTLIFKYDQLNQRMKKYRRIFSGVLTLGGSEIGKYIGEKIGTRALGGPVSAGSSYLVGEQGPELFTPRNNGSIISNHRLGGGNITVNVYGDVSGQELIEKVEQGIFNKLSLNGKLPI